MKISALIISLLFYAFTNAQGIDRKILHNCTITYDITVIDSSAPKSVVNAISKSKMKSYVKDDNSRNDFTGPGYKQTEIYRHNTDTVVVLKEMGNDKFISYIDTRKLNEDTTKGVRFVTTKASKKNSGLSMHEDYCPIS